MTKQAIEDLIKGDNYKICNSCKNKLHVSDFFLKKTTGNENSYRLNSPCKKCSYEKRNKQHYLNYYRLKKYNISTGEYNEKLKNQNSCCAICKRHISKTIKPNNPFHIDHNHFTGKIRGLLCNNCNTGIGFFDENIDFLKNAIAYLNKHKDD